MKVESAVYRALYKSLCDKIIEGIYKERQQKFKSPNRGGLFETPTGAMKKVCDRLLMDSNIHNPKYIYRQFTELNTDTIRGEINSHVLYNILFELGYKLDEKYVEAKPNKDISVPDLKAQNLLDQFVSVHAFDIREEQNKVDRAYYINPPSTLQSRASANNSKIERSEIGNYTEREYQTYFADNKEVKNTSVDFITEIQNLYYKDYMNSYSHNEYRLFTMWKNKLHQRQEWEKKLPTNLDDFIKSQVFALTEYLNNSWWEIYEVSNATITKSIINISSSDPDPLFGTVLLWDVRKSFSEDTKDYLPGYLSYDIHGRSIKIIFSIVANEWMQDFVYNFLIDDKNLFLEFSIGHLVTLNRTSNELSLRIAAIKKINTSEVEKQTNAFCVFDINSSEVPKYIREFLTSSDNEELGKKGYKNWLHTIDDLVNVYYE